MTPPSITACVIVRDAADDLAELLPQLQWADETLVLIDAQTADTSHEVAHEMGARPALAPFSSFAQFRNLALEAARCTWVLFVDADERLSRDLVDEVRAAARATEEALEHGASAPVAYWIPRRNIMFGRLIQGGGWSPDYQLRLLRRDRARYDEARPVHEVAGINGEVGYLLETLLHFNYRSPSEFFAKQRTYTAMEVGALRASGARFRRRALVGQPLREFFRRYLQLGGWRDGPIGFLLSLAMAYFAFERVRLARQDPPPMVPSKEEIR